MLGEEGLVTEVSIAGTHSIAHLALTHLRTLRLEAASVLIKDTVLLYTEVSMASIILVLALTDLIILDTVHLVLTPSDTVLTASIVSETHGVIALTVLIRLETLIMVLNRSSRAV